MKTFQDFLEETYLILDNNSYDDSYSFDHRLSSEEEEVINEDYKRLPRIRMIMKALKNFNKMRGHAIKAGAVGSDTTEGQIERYKAAKASKKAATIAATMMSHDRNRSLEQDVHNRLIGLMKKRAKNTSSSK